jgi:hypothetical protein
MDTLNLRLIHWNLAEAEEKALGLVLAGFSVQYDLPPFPKLLREISQNPPGAVLIDLSRLPSQGRDLGVALRQAKGTRDIPLLFLGGEPQKVESIRELLPDATFTDWTAIESAVHRAIDNQPAAPVAPESRFAAYAGAPLTKKLEIRAGFKVGLIEAPPEFANLLDEMPAGVVFQDGLANVCNLAIWFVRSTEDLEQNLARVTQAAGDIPLWIAWEKKSTKPAGAVRPSVTQTMVRNSGLAANWVDYKICSIDEHWSGLLFRQRKPGGKRKET